MSGTKSTHVLTSTIWMRYRSFTWAASAACNSKSGLPVDDSGPVPEQTNTRKSWPKTSRRPPICFGEAFACPFRPKVVRRSRNPEGSWGVTEGDPWVLILGVFHT